MPLGDKTMEHNPIHYDKKNPVLTSAATISGYLEAAEELNLDIEPSLKVSQIERDALLNPDRFLPLHKVVTFLNDLAERSGCDYFGFLVALHQPPTRFARIGHLLRFADTLGQAIQDAIQFSLLNSQYSRWVLEADKDYARLIRRTRVAYDEPMAQLQMLAITVVYKSMLSLTNGNMRLDQVNFAFAPCQRTHVMESFFKCPVLFNQTSNALLFSRNALNLQIPTADAEVYGLIRSQLDKLADGLNEGDRLSTRVTHHIEQTIGSRYCHLDFISSTLGVHPRALQRQLSLEGLTFKSLLSHVRQGLAEEYLLNSSISVSELSEFLGYSNPSAFSRAFKRMTGVSPDHWKAVRHKHPYHT